MKILISNDDGYDADGLLALYRGLSSLATCDVVVPDVNRSASSSALTLRQPLRSRRLDNGFTVVDGTPADCVHLAVNGLFDTGDGHAVHDMVVTGINAGVNMGDDVLYSGTVAAAIEGRFLAYPAVAFSMASYTPSHFDTGQRVAATLIQHLIDHPLPTTTILNINIPDCPYQQLAGMRLTRLGSRRPPGQVIKALDPRGEALYWIGDVGEVDDDSGGTDFHAVKHGFVSITPLHLDMTDHNHSGAMEAWMEPMQ